MGSGTTEEIKARTELWYAWAQLAIEHEASAVVERGRAVAAQAADGKPGPAISQEIKEAMVAVVAAVSAFEAIGHELTPHLIDAKAIPPRPKARWFLCTVEQLFPAALDATVRQRVRKLFDLRNDTVHYRAKELPLLPHPVGISTIAVAVTYSRETATDAVDLLMEVVSALGRHSAPVGEASWWPIRWKPALAELRSRRKQARGGQLGGQNQPKAHLGSP